MKNLSAGALLVFDFPDPRGEPRRLCFADPFKVIEAHSADEVRPALRAVQREVEAGFYAGGYVSYEAAPAFDAALAVRGGSRMPLLWFGIFKEPVPRGPSGARGEFRVSEWTPSVDAQTYGSNVAALREAIARGDT